MHSTLVAILPVAAMLMAGVTTATPTENGRWMQARNYDNGQDVYSRDISRDAFEARGVRYDNDISAREFTEAALRLRDLVDELLAAREGTTTTTTGGSTTKPDTKDSKTGGGSGGTTGGALTFAPSLSSLTPDVHKRVTEHHAHHTELSALSYVASVKVSGNKITAVFAKSATDKTGEKTETFDLAKTTGTGTGTGTTGKTDGSKTETGAGAGTGGKRRRRSVYYYN